MGDRILATQVAVSDLARQPRGLASLKVSTLHLDTGSIPILEFFVHDLRAGTARTSSPGPVRRRMSDCTPPACRPWRRMEAAACPSFCGYQRNLDAAAVFRAYPSSRRDEARCRENASRIHRTGSGTVPGEQILQVLGLESGNPGRGLAGVRGSVRCRIVARAGEGSRPPEA